MQHLLFNAYIIVASICGVVSFLHLLIYFRRRKEKIHLIFSFMALCCAVATVLDIRMNTAPDVSSFVFFLKSTNTVQVFLWISFMWFIQYYTRSNRPWVVWLVSGLYGIAGVLNLLFPHGILFDSINGINQVILPWGEPISFGFGPANPWRLLPDVAWLFMLAYALEASIRLARKGEKRRAWFFGFSIFSCLGIGYLQGTLIDLGILPPPSIWKFTFLALIILMSASLADDEEKTVGKMPIYRFVKTLVPGLVGAKEADSFTPALFDAGNGQREIIYVVEDLGDEGLTVLFPHAPTGFAGPVKIVSKNRITPLDAGLGDASLVLNHMGLGTGQLLKKRDS